jgi:hypothetical protein
MYVYTTHRIVVVVVGGKNAKAAKKDKEDE